MTMFQLAGRSRGRGLLLALIAGAAVTARAGGQVVFSADFNAPPIPAQMIPGVAQLTGAQGYAGLGHPGNQFGGQFLRSPTGNVVMLALNNLPPHSALDI